MVEAAGHDAEQSGRALGERFIEAALAALGPIEQMPAMGSPRLGQFCEVPGLRSCRVESFPVLWLYLERADHLNVLRLLGERRDLFALLRESL